MPPRPTLVAVQADKRVSQVSGHSDFSVNSNGSDTKKHKARIGPWRLGRTLGRGSSGRVRLAKHAVTGKLAAVKIVPKTTTPQTAAGLPYGIEREVVIMKLIEHPNVMRLYDVWENKGELYLVLEYIEGGELFDYLVQRGRLQETEAVNYIQQILHAVDYCHRFNICHRDLKPENLLLDKNRNIKVADFGMAALEPSGQMLQTSCGSPHYASPEIVAGKTYHGGPSDIWSCGIILFALLTGHLPFDDENIRTLLLKVKAGRFVMPPELSAEAKDLIWRMLEVDPSKRITMDKIMQHPLLKKYRPKTGKGQRLPRAPTYEELACPVKTAGEIDREILRNLQTLWRGVARDLLVQKLLEPQPNSEKTFYCLLLKYRHDRMENYTEDAPKRMIKSKSTRSVKSAASKRSVKHKRQGSRSSRRSRKSEAPLQPSPPKRVAPKPVVLAAPLVPTPPLSSKSPFGAGGPRHPPVQAPLQTRAPARLDEATRKMSAEFSQFLDVAFNSSVPVFHDTPGLDKALPSPPYDAFALQRPSSAEPSASSRTIDHKAKAHRSAEMPLPRIFEEDKDRYADAEEQPPTIGDVRGKLTVRTSAPSRASHRAALGELEVNSLRTRGPPTKPTSIHQPPQRIVSANEPSRPQSRVDRRLVSAPAAVPPVSVTAPIEPKRNWLDRMFARKVSPTSAPASSATTPPAHATLAARREAPAPPPLQIAGEPPQSPKLGFFARLLNFKPAPRSIHTRHSPNRLHREILDSLRRWEKAELGVRVVVDDRRNRIIRAQVGKRNALGLKSVRFRMEVLPDGKRALVIFTLERGAQSSFNRVVQEYEHILSQ
ncbi:serine/threonine-protein kinase gin4 [Savitreella phatthalungensis]